MKAKIFVTLKKGVYDPQGDTVSRMLSSMGYKSINGVRIGKYIEVEVADMDASNAKSMLNEVCDKLLSNAVMESYKIEME